MTIMMMSTLLILPSGPGPVGPQGPQGVAGTPGSPGAAATIAVGSVTTGSPGSSATVTNVGTSLAAIFNMSIPRGDVGAAGSNGSNGSNGVNGTAITAGSGAPSGGQNGDLYILTTNYDFYQKAAGSWSIIGNIKGAQGIQGNVGPAGPTAIGAPSSRSLSAGTAYQALDNTKPALIVVNLTSTANFSLTGGTTVTETVYMAATSGGASGGTGTPIGRYSNSVTGTIAVGLNMNSTMASAYVVPLPAGWWFAILNGATPATITSVHDLALG